MTSLDDIMAAVCALRLELLAGPAGADELAMREFVACVFSLVGDRAWNGAELVEGLPLADDDAERLAAALAGLVGEVDLGAARRLGKALRRHAWRTFGALRLERVGDDRRGALWLVRDVAPRVSAPETRTLPFPARRRA